MTDPRVETKILELIDLGFTEVEIPYAVAESLVDDECSRGLYEGCSPELEMAFTDYQSQAARVLGVEA